MVVAIAGAVLTVLIVNVIPSVFEVELTGDVHLLWVLLSLFLGLVVYVQFKQIGGRR